MIKNKSKYFSCCILAMFLQTIQCQAIAQDNSANEEPPHEGNFSLPISQQPGPLLGFGSNIIEKNQIQLFNDVTYFEGNDTSALTDIPNVLYGITDDLSIFLNVPIALELEYDINHSSGLEDTSLQLEYIYYSSQTKRYTHQSTVVGNVTFPTGSNEKNPPTGFGSYSYLVGTTLNRIYVEWFTFGFLGALLTTNDNTTRYSNEYYYQYGLGRNIYSIPDKLITAWMIEIDGVYTDKNKINGITDPNSGGNVVIMTPSLWIAGQHLVLQLGAGVPVVQNLFGDQNKNDYVLALNIGWTL